MNGSLTIASWNVFQGLDHSSRRKKWLPNKRVERHLASLDADVLVLPEAWKFRQKGERWAEELADNLGYQLHQHLSDAPSRTRDVCPWRMVILTRIPAHRLDDFAMQPLGRFGRRAFVRVALESFDLTLAGGHLYGIHAFKRDPRLWVRERADFRQITASHDIVAGDMNIWGPIVKRDSNDLRPAVKGRTWNSGRRLHSQIDHILVSDRIEVVQSEVLPDMRSDHRAIRAVLRVTG